jgi:hypothetical protein
MDRSTIVLLVIKTWVHLIMSEAWYSIFAVTFHLSGINHGVKSSEVTLVFVSIDSIVTSVDKNIIIINLLVCKRMVGIETEYWLNVIEWSKTIGVVLITFAHDESNDWASVSEITLNPLQVSWRLWLWKTSIKQTVVKFKVVKCGIDVSWKNLVSFCFITVATSSVWSLFSNSILGNPSTIC